MIIELGAAGYDPDTTFGSNMVESLERLRSIQKALRNPSPRLYKSIPLRFTPTYSTHPFTGVTWDLVACGTLAVGVFGGDDRTALGVLSLASEEMSMEKRFRVLDFDFAFDLFFVDVQQDLLLLTSGDVLHFRSFTSGQVHPRVSKRADGTYTTSLSEIPNVSDDLTARVDGEWLLVGREAGASRQNACQYLWHWPSGRTRHIVCRMILV